MCAKSERNQRVAQQGIAGPPPASAARASSWRRRHARKTPCRDCRGRVWSAQCLVRSSATLVAHSPVLMHRVPLSCEGRAPAPSPRPCTTRRCFAAWLPLLSAGWQTLSTHQRHAICLAWACRGRAGLPRSNRRQGVREGDTGRPAGSCAGPSGHCGRRSKLWLQSRPLDQML